MVISLMIIRSLNIIGVAIDKAKADAPLIIDGYGILPSSVPS